jgi:hypothetical protein
MIFKYTNLATSGVCVELSVSETVEIEANPQLYVFWGHRDQ